MNVSVTVKPGSSKGPLVLPIGDSLVVYLREKPHDGEANAALVEILADYYNVSKSQIEIKRGSKNHQKLVEIIK